MNTAIKMLLFFSQKINGNIPPIGTDFRIANDGRNRITNSGDFRYFL
jgi:hypothetical protein